MKYKKFTKTYLKSVLMSFFKIILQFYNGMECKHPNKDYLFAENDRVSLRKTVFLQKIWPQTAWNQSDCGILLFVIWQTDLNGYTFLHRRETRDGRQDCYRNYDCFLQMALSECHELDTRGKKFSTRWKTDENTGDIIPPSNGIGNDENYQQCKWRNAFRDSVGRC